MNIQHWINLTAHEIRIKRTTTADLVIPPDGRLARLIEVETSRLTVDDVEVRHLRYGELADLPEPQLGTAFIVSRVTAEAARRPDVYFPDREIRDDTGKIIACEGLGHFVP